VWAAAPDSNSEVDGVEGEEGRSRMLRLKERKKKSSFVTAELLSGKA
jgi:hypothetical protein